MSCTCGSDQVSKKKMKILQRKYDVLRKDHKRLVGVAVELTHALEKYVRGNEKPDIKDTLTSCSNIYPSLFERSSSSSPEPESNESEKSTKSDVKEMTTDEYLQETEKTEDRQEEKAPNSEMEYKEGFWSRPRIPRTPQL